MYIVVFNFVCASSIPKQKQIHKRTRQNLNSLQKKKNNNYIVITMIFRRKKNGKENYELCTTFDTINIQKKGKFASIVFYG